MSFKLSTRTGSSHSATIADSDHSQMGPPKMGVITILRAFVLCASISRIYVYATGAHARLQALS